MASTTGKKNAKNSLVNKRVLHSQAREIVYNVFEYFVHDFQLLNPHEKPILKDIKLKVSQATKVGFRTVERILTEKKNMEGSGSNLFSTPGKTRPKRIKKCDMDDFDKCALRRIINNFHMTESERPTLATVLKKAREDLNFKGSRESLRMIIQRLGFKWRKCEDNRQLLMERHNNKYLRYCYLRDIKRYRREGRNIVYTDETYINSSHTKKKGWSDNSGEGLKTPIGKGARAIVVHAGGEKGFVQGAELLYKSTQTCGDYHHDMNYINYEKWLKTQLIPNLPQNSVVVMDNASYHNTLNVKAPTSSSRKSIILDWLREKRLPHSENMPKVLLYQIVKENKDKYCDYKVDRLFSESGHIVLRLPPYHPDLNPIEKIWAQIKDYVAKKNTSFKLDDAMKLAREKIAALTEKNWKEVCDHVIKVEDEYVKVESVIENLSERIVINLADSSDEEDEDFDMLPQEKSDSESEVDNDDSDLGCKPL